MRRGANSPVGGVRGTRVARSAAGAAASQPPARRPFASFILERSRGREMDAARSARWRRGGPGRAGRGLVALTEADQPLRRSSRGHGGRRYARTAVHVYFGIFSRLCEIVRPVRLCTVVPVCSYVPFMIVS